MSSDTFTTAMFLITAVIAAGVLINAVFPVVYQMAGTFNSATHASDLRLRTDFVIVATFASSSTSTGQVYIKNIGTQAVSQTEIQGSDVFFGPVGTFRRLDRDTSGPLSEGMWNYHLSDLNDNGYWDTGETLEIDSLNSAGSWSGPGTQMYFQFLLPNGVYRTSQFTAS